ncbi:MAG: hypothetical protein Q4E28_04830, partial [Clostridia bacterium]|nr:hypothetical protein [Clostridia bacterium]
QKPTQKPNTTQGKLPTPDYLKNDILDEKEIEKIAKDAGLIYDWEYDVRKQNCSWQGYDGFDTREWYIDAMQSMKERGITRVRFQRVDRSNYKTFTPEALDPDYFPQSSYERLCKAIENFPYEEKYNAYCFVCTG